MMGILLCDYVDTQGLEFPIPVAMPEAQYAQRVYFEPQGFFGIWDSCVLQPKKGVAQRTGKKNGGLHGLFGSSGFQSRL